MKIFRPCLHLPSNPDGVPTKTSPNFGAATNNCKVSFKGGASFSSKSLIRVNSLKLNS